MLEHSMPLIPSVVIMFVASFILSYYINETISLRRNITTNKHKLYMALFMAFQMGLIELLMHYYYMGSMNIYLLILLIIGIAYTGHQLYTLKFLNDKQFLLAMIEHHQNAIEMVNAHEKYYHTTNPQLIKLLDQIKNSQQKEIINMYSMLKESTPYFASGKI